MSEHKEKINALEEVTQIQPTTSGSSFTGAARNSLGNYNLAERIAKALINVDQKY